MSEVSRLLEETNAARRRLIAATEGLTPEQERFRLGPEEWSVPQVVEHLVLAETGGIYGMWAVAQATRHGAEPWEGDLPNQGRTIEEIIARTWREREDAPDSATPQIDGPLAFCVAELEGCQYLLASFAAALHGLDPEAIIYPHFLMGPLNVYQRFEFLRWHMDHHLEQIEEIRAAMPG